MHGQASLEFMVVLAVFLAALGAWLAVVSGASHAISGALGQRHASLAAANAAYAINEACLMGPGNSVRVSLSVPGNASVKTGLVLEWSGQELAEKVYCGFEEFTFSGTQSFVFENDNGFIRTRKT